MSKVEDFLTREEENEIVQAISQAERNTSGEIRVHIEDHTEKPPLERAQEVFNFWVCKTPVCATAYCFM